MCPFCIALGYPCASHQTKTTKPNDLLIVDGVKCRPLLTGEIRLPGDVFMSMGQLWPELPQFVGTPQTRIEKDDFLSQSYRPL